MVDELMADFAVTAGAVGSLSASYFYAYAGLQLPIGFLLDRHGTRRVFVGAAALCTIGALLFASSSHLAVAHVGRVLLGAGSGVAWVGCLKLIALWFPIERFALMSGMALSFGMIGAVLGQGPLAAVIAQLGWRQTMSGTAIVAVGLALALQRLPDDRPTGERSSAPPSILRGLRVVLSSRQTWYAACYGSLMTVPMLGFATLWGVPYLTERFDVSRPVAGAATSLLLVGWGFGAPLFGWWSSRAGQRRRLMVVGAAANLGTITAALYAPGLPFGAVATLLFLNGLGSGSMPLCFAHARSHQPIKLAATAFGFANMLVIALAAVVQPLIGVLMDLHWDGTISGGARHYGLGAYQLGLVLIPVSVAGALLLALLLRDPAAPSRERPDPGT
jgi:MFS family permease